MKLLTDWGFSWEGWRQGSRGEYWVAVQALLVVEFALLPVYRVPGFKLPIWLGLYVVLPSAAILALSALLLFFKGFWDLGHSLTPLPYPRDDGELVQAGVYSVVRHPIYSGLILGSLGWALYQLSVTHLVGAIALFIFFNAKASREESWLIEKYPDYPEYCQRVKKLIPGLY
ncbi:MAG: isoprenylcysteine carboxylmethyltransferase family protein [Leptolyngbyaceae cyanobacterium CSU_1_4]|nr:isoprenylcysteine carboxylmethyltransferase family protein [Leptolyngbyaceae cyanobacterium CSU_1_4]